MSHRSFAIRAITLCAVLSLLTAAATAQPPGGGRGGRGGRGGFGGGFGFGGGRGMMDSSFLLRIEKVQTVLDLSLDQGEQIKGILEQADEARQSAFQGVDFQSLQDLSEDERRERMDKMRTEMEALNKETKGKVDAVLDDKQRARLKGISVQVRGTAALLDEEIATELKIDDNQKQQLTAAQEEAMEARRELGGGFGPGGGQDVSDEERAARRAKREEIDKARDEKMMAVLTSDQAAQFEAMKGEKFELAPEDYPGFGPGGRGGRGGRGGGGGRGQGGGNNA